MTISYTVVIHGALLTIDIICCQHLLVGLADMNSCVNYILIFQSNATAFFIDGGPVQWTRAHEMM